MSFVIFLAEPRQVLAWWPLPTIDRAASPQQPALAVCIDLALVALFGLQHSVMARPWFKRRVMSWIPEGWRGRPTCAVPNIPNRSNRKTKFRWKKAIYRQRNRVERFFNKLKQFRRVATRYEKLGANFFAFVKLASVRIWLRSIESTASDLATVQLDGGTSPASLQRQPPTSDSGGFS